MTKDPTISVLVSARKNSKYLAKFIFNYLAYTQDHYKTDLYVMLNKQDTWNKELVSYLEENEYINFFYENKGLGRGGLHEYFNDLAKEADSDWLIYFCDDHLIVMDQWDKYFRGQIAKWGLDPEGIHCLIPKFDNVGAMNQMLSRGYLETLGRLGRHGNIDSYINDVNLALGSKLEKQVVHRFDDETFHDFTHDSPSVLDDSWTKTKLSAKGAALPKYANSIVQAKIEKDANKLRLAIERSL